MIIITAKIIFSSTETYNIDSDNLISLNVDMYDRGDLSLPNWGIVSNGGNLEFFDWDGTILSKTNNNQLNSSYTIEVYLENTENENKELIAIKTTDTWDYDNNNFHASVQLIDDLVEWQDIQIKGIPFNFLQPNPQNGKYFYEELYKFTPTKYKMTSYTALDSATKTHLESITIKYPILKSSSLWDAWHKLCVVFQLHIFKGKNGSTMCYYNGGN